ncbi:hypothetical protein BKA57DRAFT_126588 [Linnemannia elongata]|nr:hypothetical protein BKA57DRAFT_126588 [Linnemannia elongata]
MCCWCLKSVLIVSSMPFFFFLYKAGTQYMKLYNWNYHTHMVVFLTFIETVDFFVSIFFSLRILSFVVAHRTRFYHLIVHIHAGYHEVE